MSSRVLKTLITLGLLVTCGSSLCFAQMTDAFLSGLALTPERAVSTTGPTRPPEVELAEPTFAKTLISSTVIANVPAYMWWDGCGPTAVGMVLGYYDALGFDDLIPGDAMSNLEAVRQAIASHGSPSDPQHYEDYSLPLDSYNNIKPDKSELPDGDEHPSNCLADFMRTSFSRDGLPYGWSYSDKISVSWVEYVSLAAPHYQATAENYWPSKPITWSLFTTEIDNNRPMVLLVDTLGDGSTDHFVTAIGYGDDGTYQYYACYDTWNAAVNWQKFQTIGTGKPWGIWGGTRFHIESKATPTPPYTGISPLLWDLN